MCGQTRYLQGRRGSIPGIASVVLVAAGARAAEWLQHVVLGKSVLEAIVVAILLGAFVRTLWRPSPSAQKMIGCLAKIPLECAIVLMGLALGDNAARIVDTFVLIAMAGFVLVAVGGGWVIGRASGLSAKMAALIACGNAICGNSAIAAVAPAIRASDEEVTAAIAFTAIISMIVVLVFPIVAFMLDMAPNRAGAMAGLIIYAVPQVIAASAPFGAIAIQTGMIIKLLRVLMLAPVCIVLSIVFSRRDEDQKAGWGQMLVLPWFIVGFIAAAAIQHEVSMPAAILAPASRLAGGLTLVSMAALGLNVDLSRLLSLGGRTVVAVGGSLAVVIGAGASLISFGLI